MPLPANKSSFSPATDDLGLGGLLGEQVAGETDEMRKKRLAQMQQNKMMGPAGSPATLMLFGGAGSGSGA